MNKLALSPLIASVAKTIAPKLLSLSRTTINPATAKMVGGTIGAVGGGTAGASAAPEGEKGKGFLIGAAAGGTAGFFGGKTVAGFGKGGVDAARLQGFAKELKTLAANKKSTNSEFFQGVGNYLGKNWANPTHLQAIPKGSIVGAPKHRPMLGWAAKSPVQAVPENLAGSGFTRFIGNSARNVMGIAKGEFGVKGTNPLSRTFNVLKSEANEARYYTKDGFRYKRSLPGQALGVAFGSGVGIGAVEGITATNNDGTPASVPKKLLKGTASTLGWGLAPSLMGAKAIAYDIPKFIINPES